MALFEITITLLIVGALLTGLARRLGAPYPAFLAVAGAGLALVPGTPALELSPDLVLTLFVAPTLLDSAYDASPRDLRDNWRPIAGSAVVAVILTVIAVAIVARALRPGMPWAAALALGAIVAPPDASAATAVLRALRPPHRVMVILEGESLLNDATALLIYRVAVAAAIGQWTGWSGVPMLAFSLVGSVVVGVVLGRVYPRLTARIADIPTSVMLQFIGTFGLWILATRLELSPIVTLLCYAMTIARRGATGFDARRRIQSYAVWDVAVFVLNVLAFILTGLQLRPILAGLHGVDWRDYALFGGAVLLTCIVVRIVWVMGYNTTVRWKNRRFGTHLADRLIRPTVGGGMLISWCGMRGIVTLATALALPDGSEGGFPFRSLILFSAFAVVLGTLVIQGLTLRPLMRVLELPEDNQVEREIAHARQHAAEKALASIADAEGDDAATLRREYERLARRVDGREAQSSNHEHRARALVEERRAILALRAAGEIGDDAFHVIEAEIDWAQMYLEGRLARSDADA